MSNPFGVSSHRSAARLHRTAVPLIAPLSPFGGIAICATYNGAKDPLVCVQGRVQPVQVLDRFEAVRYFEVQRCDGAMLHATDSICQGTKETGPWPAMDTIVPWKC